MEYFSVCHVAFNYKVKVECYEKCVKEFQWGFLIFYFYILFYPIFVKIIKLLNHTGRLVALFILCFKCINT